MGVEEIHAVSRGIAHLGSKVSRYSLDAACHSCKGMCRTGYMKRVIITLIKWTSGLLCQVQNSDLRPTWGLLEDFRVWLDANLICFQVRLICFVLLLDCDLKIVFLLLDGKTHYQVDLIFTFQVRIKFWAKTNQVHIKFCEAKIKFCGSSRFHEHKSPDSHLIVLIKPWVAWHRRATHTLTDTSMFHTEVYPT